MMRRESGSKQGAILGILLGLVLLSLIIAFGVLLTISITRDRDAGQYPGSVELTSHSNYTGLPRQIRWDNSYYTSDEFTDVYNWYSTEFNLGAESRAIGRCILLDGPAEALVWERYYTVMICNTEDGQLVYVTRSTILKSPR